MKIAIIGAGGMVGSRVAAEAVRRGHEIVAYTRSGRSLPTGPSTALELTDTSAVVDAVHGADVAVIAVGSRDDYAAAIAAHRALIEAAPTGRLLVVGGAGALEVGDGLLLDSPDFPAEYLPEAKTFAEVLSLYRASKGLHWTMIAPSPMIAPGVRTGEYVAGQDQPAGNFVSSEDFAVAIIDEAESDTHAGTRFTVASANEEIAAGK